MISEALSRGSYKPERSQEAALLLPSPALSATASGPPITLFQAASPAWNSSPETQTHDLLSCSLQALVSPVTQQVRGPRTNSATGFFSPSFALLY